MKILVTGGTGRIGAGVLRELKKRGADVRVLVRKNGTSLPDGVEVAVGDLLDPVSVQKAMDGVDKLYLLNAVSPDELTQGLIAYDLAKKLKLKHIVYHSFSGWSILKMSSLRLETRYRKRLARVRCPFYCYSSKLLLSE